MRDAGSVVVEQPTMAAVDSVVELWLELAEDQREHGSLLEVEANRSRIRESISRQIALSELQVARTEDTIVGFVMYSIQRGPFTRTKTRGLIQNIYVEPDYRGAGIGSKLLAAAETALSESGAEVISLEAMAANERAQEFYRQHGYDCHRVTLEKPTENDTS